MAHVYKETVVDPKILNAWFPTEYQAVLFRTWGMYSAEKLAEVLEATPEDIRASWELMGLDPDRKIDPEWRRRGYITTVRDTWHILSKPQQCTLLGISAEEYEIMLREDDFLDHKLSYKAEGTQCYWRPLTEEETAKTRELAKLLKDIEEKIGDAPDTAFDFARNYYKPASPITTPYPTFIGKDMKFIYSYFALYGDPLIDETLDPFPDKLLEEYAKYGVNGVWMQGVLYQLVHYPFAPEMSAGWEIRQKNLKKLVDRAAKYGIGIYLYFNEPRWMPMSVFEKHPEIQGRTVEDKGMACLCTSTPEVQEYLENGAYQLFKAVEGLAGFFTITRSENPTNCYSHTNEDNCNCPRCSQRSVPEVLAEVNNFLYRGAKRANPDARGIAWVWGWPDNRVEKVIELLDDGIIFQSTSETLIEVHKGAPVKIADYSMSNPGPGEWAKNNWRLAKKHNHECCAKVQFNNTWECSGVPYIPVFDLVAEHAVNLKNEGIRHMMLSWTLGGAPSPSLSLVSGIFDGKYKLDTCVDEMIDDVFPVGCAETVKKAQRMMSDAFRQFPFSCAVVYASPLTSGPRSVFYTEKTGRRGARVGISFDSVDAWTAEYAEDVFERQMTLVVEPWREAIKLLDACDDKSELFEEFKSCAKGTLVHFESVLHLTRFVRARNAMLDGEKVIDGNRDVKQVMMQALDEEEANTINAIRAQSKDSRIGFEASNHYNFSRQNLVEKLVNIDYTRRKLNK